MSLSAVPVELSVANEFVGRVHRHHGEVVGHKFSIGALSDGELVGVVIVGRPVSRMRDDGKTLEVTRLCTDGTRNACSFLYGRAARAVFALGYERLASESGASLKAAGWRWIGHTRAKVWRPGQRLEAKELWEAVGG